MIHHRSGGKTIVTGRFTGRGWVLETLYHSFFHERKKLPASDFFFFFDLHFFVFYYKKKKKSVTLSLRIFSLISEFCLLKWSLMIFLNKYWYKIQKTQFITWLCLFGTYSFSFSFRLLVLKVEKVLKSVCQSITGGWDCCQYLSIL